MKQKNSTQLVTKSDIIILEDKLNVKFEKLTDEVSDMEKSINKRVTMVGDLITTSLTKILENHERRIRKLEKSEKLIH